MLRSLVPSTLLAGAVAAGSILAAPAGAADTPSPSARAVTTLTGFSLAAMPRDRITWVSYEHEMDAKVKEGHYAAADVRTAYVRFANLVTASGNPMIKKTLILTGWDYRNRMLTYYPGAAYVDTLAVDKYRWGTETIPYLFDEAFAVAAAYGKPLGVAEFGVWSGTDAERAAISMRRRAIRPGRCNS